MCNATAKGLEALLQCQDGVGKNRIKTTIYTTAKCLRQMRLREAKTGHELVEI